MAKRQRDYRAEEARRNARARQLGFSSRAQMRRALKQGTPVEYDRRGTIIRILDVDDSGSTRTQKAERNIYRSRRQEARAWSDAHSRVETSRYNTSFTQREFNAYYDAYINPDTKANRIENDLFALEDFLVDILGVYTPEEFDERYRTL